MADERVLLRNRGKSYIVREETFMGEIDASLTYFEEVDGDFNLYAKRRARELVSDNQKNKPQKIGTAHDSEEADEKIYESAIKDAQKLSRNTGKAFVDLTKKLAS